MKKSKEVMTLKLSIYFVGEGEGRHKTGDMEGYVGCLAEFNCLTWVVGIRVLTLQ